LLRGTVHQVICTVFHFSEFEGAWRVIFTWVFRIVDCLTARPKKVMQAEKGCKSSTLHPQKFIQPNEMVGGWV